jgi:hypothetical protein
MVDSVKNKGDSNNEYSRKLKVWSVEMPNAAYSNRTHKHEKAHKTLTNK